MEVGMSDAPAKQKVDPQVMKVAMVLIVGGLAVVFDTTIVSLALHTLANQLHTSVATIQWVSTGYLLALGVTIPLVGWAQNRFGGKRVWMFALMVFLAGSIGSSLAWSASSLIGFRVVQGVGGGVMLPLMATLVMQAAAGKSLGRTMSVVSLPAVLGPILGPVLGGVILNWLDWRGMFYVNIPFCVVGFLLAWKMLPTDPKMPRRPLDVLGFVLLSPGIVGILYGLSNASKTDGFARPDVYAPMLIGVALLLAFVIYALRRGDRALVDVRLFAHRAVASASALLFLSGAALYGAMLLMPLYFQEVRGVDALGAGLLLVPQGIGTFFSRSLAGRLTDTLGAKWVTLIGFAIVGAATIPFAFANAKHQRVVPDGRSPRPRLRARRRHHPPDDRRLHRTGTVRHPAREHHHPHRPAARRLLRRRTPRRHPRRRPRTDRHKPRIALIRLRPSVLVVDRLHRRGRRALARPARQTKKADNSAVPAATRAACAQLTAP